MKRVGSIIGVDIEKLEEYKKLHSAVWYAIIPFIIETACFIAIMSM